jgi:hypothetical protein
MWDERKLAAKRLWNHPDRAFKTAPKSFWEELGRRVALGALSYAGVQIAKRGLSRALPVASRGSRPHDNPSAQRMLDDPNF